MAAAKLLSNGWFRPNYRRPTGPHEPTAFDHYATALEEQFSHIRLAIDALTDNDLQMHANYYKKRPLGGTMTPCLAIFEAMDAISELHQPSWFAAGFNVVGREPDYHFWAKMKTWSLDEATALSIGFEPTGKIEFKKGESIFTQSVVTYYSRRRKLIENNFFPFSDQTIQQLRPSPGQFCKWAISVHLEVPSELYQAVSKLYDIPKAEVAKKEEATVADPALDPRERTSLLTLVRLLATKAYAFDPQKERSDVANRIQSDLHLMGMDLHIQTIRRHLKAAGAILPSDTNNE